MKFSRNLFFIFVIILLCQNESFSQDFIPGIRFGLNISNLKSDQFAGSTPRKGIDAGVTFTAVMGDKLDIISEMTFSQKGAIIKGYDSDTSSPVDFKMYYNSLQYAAIINYYLKAPNLSIQAGPYFAYNMAIARNSAFFGKTNDPLTDMSSYDLAEGITGVEVGPVIGISGGSESIRINLRYMAGFKNYYKKVDYNGLGYKVTGSTIHLSISYLFNNVRVSR